MQAPWISYAHELPVNRALPFWLDIKPGEEIANYTRAWAQDSGWMWQIPTQTRYGCGYVYSDEFSHARTGQGRGRARAGPRDRGAQRYPLPDRAAGKCLDRQRLAVGLSSSFLEPLESTSIHGTIVQMMLFADRLPQASAAT